MAIPMTLCGLLASPAVQWQSWKPAFYRQELAEIDPAVAQSFTEREVDTEGTALAEFDTDFLLCVMHDGHDIDRCERIDCADQEVDPDEELRRYPVKEIHTVCGMVLDDGRAYSGLWTANGPRMAFAAAHNYYRAEHGLILAVANVHLGAIPHAPESPTWADATCTDEAQMADRLAELIPGGLTK